MTTNDVNIHWTDIIQVHHVNTTTTSDQLKLSQSLYNTDLSTAVQCTATNSTVNKLTYYNN